MHDGTTPNHTRRDNLFVALAVIALMLVGGALRFVGLSWDDYTMMHPDERFLMQVTSGLGGGHIYVFSDPSSLTSAQQTIRENCLARYPATMGSGGYFDAECSPYNPHNQGHATFVYGTLPVFMFRGMAEIFALVTRDPGWTGLIQTFTPARTVSALAETLVILVVFCIGLRAHDKWVGLLAAFLYAFTTFSIQQAHFGTADATANLFVALTILLAICIQREGRVRNYVLFGAALACALASRINLLPLAGLLAVVAVIRVLPAFARGIDRDEREMTWTEVGVGVIAALLTTFVVFRLLNPYAFTGPSIFGVSPNREWLDDVALSRFFVSGDAEIPPNWQWVARPRYLFALWNMVAWGMGLALGIVGWVAALVAFWRIVRGKPGALANAVPAAWIIAYFGFTGGLWVMTMRYYLPLYPAVALMAAWAIVALIRARRRINTPVAGTRNGASVAAQTDDTYDRIRDISGTDTPLGVPTPHRSMYRPSRAARVSGVLLLIVVCGFTVAWGLGFAQNYTRLLTRVEGSYWFWEQVPGDFAMRIDGAPEGTPLVNIAIANSQYVGARIDWENQATRFPRAGTSYYSDFTAPADGTVSSIIAPHLGDLTDTPAEEVFRFNILRTRDSMVIGTTELTADLTRENHVLGDRYDIPFDLPVPLEEGAQYRFIVTLEEGEDVVSGGSLVVWEGDWDDPMPQKTCTPSDGLTLANNPPPGRFGVYECNGRDVYWALMGGGYKLQMADNDSVRARENILRLLETTDYIFVGSNRFYDPMARNRTRWPFANRYYDALFSGELGFEIAAVFDRGFRIGPLYIPTNNLPMHNAPNWVNELEAEEAFHVYDHPAVIIFRKTDEYSQERAVAILDSVPMQTAAAARPLFNCPENLDAYYCDPTLIDTDLLTSVQAARVPTYLQIPEEDRAAQYTGATWSERFDSEAAINTNQVLTVAAWWLTMVVMGWAAFPLLFVLLPALNDRGYGLAKTAGLLLVAWGTWYIASVTIPAWNSRGILAVLIVLAALSLAVVWRRRGEFITFVRERWRMMLGIEFIALLAFLFFVGVRLTNPDLWHFAFGGEKPMDFAYFNGVLRSSVFPPIDPWYADGYINYYYFGFVLVGTPTLLLGVMPQIAYNLAIPTVFSLTAIGAFSVAYNLAQALGRRKKDSTTADAMYGVPTPPPDLDRRLGGEVRPLNPWLAGIAALLLAVVLGNLDTPRTFFTGVMSLGGYDAPGSLADYLSDQAVGASDPDSIDYAALEARAQNPSIADRISYSLSGAGEALRALGTGFGRILQGAPLPIPPHRWYWGPTRIFNENPADLGIVELPYFTFLYGDLHAHMIAMPMQFLVIGVLMSEILAARRGARPTWMRFGALAVLGIAAGMLNATNTWDWITYLILCLLGLGFAWWLAWRGKLSRASLLALLGGTGGFFVLQWLATLPYTSWYAGAYTSVQIWSGDKSHLWGFLSVHGLFLFLLITLLTWETGRWFRNVPMSSLRPYGPLLVGGLIIVMTAAAGVVLAVVLGYQAALIVVPLILWIALLFFRPGQSRAMQYILALLGLSLSLMLGVEVIVLSGDIGRMNTMFKFYIQVWLMLSVIGGVAFAVVWASLDAWRSALRNTWMAVLILLVTIAALFPVMATRGRALDRFSLEVPTTLDGMAYMNYAVHGENDEYIPLEGDYRMIRWMQENIAGLPTIMEGQSEANLYKWGSRIAINTGLPAVIGWDWHQTQQRGLYGMPSFIRQRGSNVNAFYNTLDIATAQRILDFYDVEYIVVGELERVYYPEPGLAKLDEMVEQGLLEVVYSDGEDRIYRVLRPDAATVAQRVSS